MASGSQQEEIARLVLELGRRLETNLEARLADLNLTRPQAFLLRSLGDSLPMNEAADKLQCDPSNVTGIVDRLEARGLIKRQHLSKDRRVKHLVLTPAGRRLRRRVDAILSDTPGLSSLAAGDQAALQALLARTLQRSETATKP